MPNDDLDQVVTEVLPSGLPDTQPLANLPSRKRREWIPSEWSAPGEGGGAPKLGGGIEIDTKTGQEAPRSYNRPDQRYALPAGELQSRREARAAAEYPDTVILIGEDNIIEVRSISGNNYSVASDMQSCDCPDNLRLIASGRTDVACKHRLMAQMAWAAELSGIPIPWSTARAAQEAGVAVETVRQACANGLVVASKVHNVWLIQPNQGQTLAAMYTRSQPRILVLTPDTVPAGTGATAITITGVRFTPYSRAVWAGTTVLTSLFVPAIPAHIPQPLAYTEVTCAIPPALLTMPGVFNIRIENAYRGGSTSEPVLFTVS